MSSNTVRFCVTDPEAARALANEFLVYVVTGEEICETIATNANSFCGLDAGIIRGRALRRAGLPEFGAAGAATDDDLRGGSARGGAVRTGGRE